MRTVLMAAVLALGLAPTAQAEPTPEVTRTEPTAKAQPAKTKKVCRREDKTGSVVPKRVCRTVAVDEAPKASSKDGAGEAPRSTS